MINVFDSNKNVSYFESLNEFTNYLETTPAYDSSRDNASHSGGESFTGTKSFSEALKLCKYGDTDLCSYIYKQSLSIDNVDTVSKIKRSTVNDVVGFMPNVPNYVLGIPTNMIRDNKTHINSKILNIYINLSARASTDKDEIKKNAAKYVTAIDKLEDEGYRCNVYVGNVASKYDRAYYALIVKIKSDKEPLNLMKMAFPLCHPSMLRRLSFKWIETIPIDFGSSYGRPVDDDETINKLLSSVFRDTKITILSISENKGNVTDVMNILKKKGMVKQ